LQYHTGDEGGFFRNEIGYGVRDIFRLAERPIGVNLIENILELPAERLTVSPRLDKAGSGPR